ncbi:MAG: hypothetical protein RLZZ76_286 [Candidatus Parcubacteria bacterium]|jgi:hypothetical protein
MKKYAHILAKVVFSLILVLPILGTTGIFPPATRDLYNSDEAFAFIEALTAASYIMYMMSVVHILAIIALWTRREAVGALLALPITLNVVGFHLFLDGGLLTGGAALGNIMLLINLYLMWKNKEVLQALIKPQ